MALQEVEISALQPERFEQVMQQGGLPGLRRRDREGPEFLDDRVVWNVNSTARGGGVAEMLASLLAYARGAGVDARWMVISGNPDFFRVTKRIHNNLHGAPGDGGPLEADRARVYEANLEDERRRARSGLVSERDIVILHDPQTAGLVDKVRRTGAKVIWRCHVGPGHARTTSRAAAWDFLRPYVRPADAYVFSREAFAWERLEDSKIHVIPPSIDAFSPKNQELEQSTVGAILGKTGLLENGDGDPVFTRHDRHGGTRREHDRDVRSRRRCRPTLGWSSRCRAGMP